MVAKGKEKRSERIFVCLKLGACIKREFIRSCFKPLYFVLDHMDSGSLEALDEKVALGSSSLEKIALNDDEEEEVCYGELILLGYNGSLESSRPNSHGRKHRSKMTLKQRQVGNGIKKGQSVEITANPKQAPLVQDSTKHVVSYVHKSHTVLVEYLLDSGKDMFQVVILCFD